jgi:hypothetical protein
MLLHFVVISVFDRDNHRAARLGPKDPDFAHQSVAETLRFAGIVTRRPSCHPLASARARAYSNARTLRPPLGR